MEAGRGPTDFDAAEASLSIRLDAEKAKSLVKKLKHVTLTERRADDIIMACRREPLPVDDPGVRQDPTKVAQGQGLSPVVVVSLAEWADIADGYHRVSLTYALDPVGSVPVRIAALHD
jgi:hypothetical protein